MVQKKKEKGNESLKGNLLIHQKKFCNKMTSFKVSIKVVSLFLIISNQLDGLIYVR